LGKGGDSLRADSKLGRTSAVPSVVTRFLASADPSPGTARAVEVRERDGSSSLAHERTTVRPGTPSPFRIPFIPLSLRELSTRVQSPPPPSQTDGSLGHRGAPLPRRDRLPGIR